MHSFLCARYVPFVAFWVMFSEASSDWAWQSRPIYIQSRRVPWELGSTEAGPRKEPSKRAWLPLVWRDKPRLWDIQRFIWHEHLTQSSQQRYKSSQRHRSNSHRPYQHRIILQIPRWWWWQAKSQIILVMPAGSKCYNNCNGIYFLIFWVVIFQLWQGMTFSIMNVGSVPLPNRWLIVDTW